MRPTRVRPAFERSSKALGVATAPSRTCRRPDRAASARGSLRRRHLGVRIFVRAAPHVLGHRLVVDGPLLLADLLLADEEPAVAHHLVAIEPGLIERGLRVGHLLVDPLLGVERRLLEDLAREHDFVERALLAENLDDRLAVRDAVVNRDREVVRVLEDEVGVGHTTVASKPSGVYVDGREWFVVFGISRPAKNAALEQRRRDLAGAAEPSTICSR